MKKLLLLAGCLLSFANTSAFALPGDDCRIVDTQSPTFCPEFDSAAHCYCTKFLPAAYCNTLPTVQLYFKMIDSTPSRSVEAGCTLQRARTGVPVDVCVRNWNAYCNTRHCGNCSR